MATDLAAVEVAVSPVEKFREFLLTKGMRLTPEREAIVSAVFASHDHFDADAWVNDLSQRRDGGRVSRSTVYRTLNLMVEAGMLRKVARANDREVYEHDYGYPRHDHLICKSCGSMTEFDNDEISGILEDIAARYGFRMAEHRLEVYGACAECSQPPQRRHRKLDMI